MEVVNHSEPYSWSTKELHKVEGYIADSRYENLLLIIFEVSFLSTVNINHVVYLVIE